MVGGARHGRGSAPSFWPVPGPRHGKPSLICLTGGREDIELMLKTELMGRMGHFEIQVERRIDDLVNRVTALEAHAAPAS